MSISMLDCAAKRFASTTAAPTLYGYLRRALSIAFALALVGSGRADAARTTDFAGLELLPASAAPVEMLAIESALSNVSTYTSPYYAWNLAVVDTRLTVLGVAGKKPKVASADLSARIEPVVLAPINGSMKIELYLHYYADRADAKKAYQSQADELSFVASEERGVRDEYISELRSLDFERYLAGKVPLGVIIEYAKLKYETTSLDWPLDSFIQGGSGSILALVAGAKSGAYTLRIDFKAESAPDVKALVGALANTVFTAGFGGSPGEYKPFAADKTVGDEQVA